MLLVIRGIKVYPCLYIPLSVSHFAQYFKFPIYKSFEIDTQGQGSLKEGQYWFRILPLFPFWSSCPCLLQLEAGTSVSYGHFLLFSYSYVSIVQYKHMLM